MIDAIVRLALRHRSIVVAATAAICLLGAMRVPDIPVDVFPDVSAPRVAILTEVPGLPAVEVEQLVTYPIETTVHGTGGVRRMRSASAAGLSIVWLDFDWETPTWLARQRTTERLSAAALPPQAEQPFLAPASSVMAEIAFVAIVPREGESYDSSEIRRVAEVIVRRRLLATPGVAEVTVIGGHKREYQVLLDPARLDSHDLTPHDVADAIEAGTQNAGGGWVVERGIESVVRVLGRADSVDEIAAISIRTLDGVPLYVRDIAEVRVGEAVRRGTGGYDGKPAVVLGVLKQPGADTLETTEAMDSSLDDLEDLLERRGLAIERESFRQSAFIQRATDNLFNVLRDGAILVAIVLIFFLWNPSATIVSVLALPVSLLAATLALDFFGMSLNTMTLGGLAIAVGELVDDAIVDVENVTRRLRERAQVQASERPSVVSTVLKGSLEVRSAIVSATLVIGLVFVPLLFLSGFEGRLLRPLATAYLIAIGASLIVALTLTPALCALVLKTRDKEPPVQHKIVELYKPQLRRAITHPWVSVVVTFALTMAGVIAIANAGRGFLPRFNEGSLNVLMIGVPGTPLEDSDALGRMADEALLTDPAVMHVTRRTGQADRDEHVLGPETNEMEVLLRQDDPRSRDELLADLRETLSIVPGANPAFGQPISHRIDHMLSGQRSALAVRIVGPDLDRIRRVAERVQDVLRTVDGAVDVQLEPIVDIPHLEIVVDQHAASRYGFSRGAAAEAIGAALWGREVGAVLEEGTSTPIRVRYPDDVREDRLRLRSALVATPSGAAVPIDALADLREERSANYVMRENATRRVVVTANVAGRDETSVARDAEAAIDAGLTLPPDVHLEYAGRHEQERAATLRLLILALFALLGVALVVGVTLRSRRRALIVLVNLPLALAGGVVGVYFAGGVMSLATTIGFITLFGIATRNGLLLATRVGDLEREGATREQAVLQGASERLSPILMTAITAALGLLPLGLSLGDPGAEIQAPMALVILTGLASSTLLNMFVVPSLLARWGGEPAETNFAAPSDA